MLSKALTTSSLLKRWGKAWKVDLKHFLKINHGVSITSSGQDPCHPWRLVKSWQHIETANLTFLNKSCVDVFFPPCFQEPIHYFNSKIKWFFMATESLKTLGLMVKKQNWYVIKYLSLTGLWIGLLSVCWSILLNVGGKHANHWNSRSADGTKAEAPAVKGQQIREKERVAFADPWKGISLNNNITPYLKMH